MDVCTTLRLTDGPGMGWGFMTRHQILAKCWLWLCTMATLADCIFKNDGFEVLVPFHASKEGVLDVCTTLSLKDGPGMGWGFMTRHQILAKCQLWLCSMATLADCISKMMALRS